MTSQRRGPRDRSPNSARRNSAKATIGDSRNRKNVDHIVDLTAHGHQVSDESDYELRVANEYKQATHSVASIFIVLVATGVLVFLFLAAMAWFTVSSKQLKVVRFSYPHSWIHAWYTTFVARANLQPGDVLIAVTAVLALNASINLALAVSPDVGDTAVLADRVQLNQWRANMRGLSSAAAILAVSLALATVVVLKTKDGLTGLSAAVIALFAAFLAASIRSVATNATERARSLGESKIALRRVEARLMYLGLNASHDRVPQSRADAPASWVSQAKRAMKGYVAPLGLLAVAQFLALSVADVIVYLVRRDVRSPFSAEGWASALVGFGLVYLLIECLVLIPIVAWALPGISRKVLVYIPVGLAVLWLGLGIALIFAGANNLYADLTILSIFASPLVTFLLMLYGQPRRGLSRRSGWFSAGVWRTVEESLNEQRAGIETRLSSQAPAPDRASHEHAGPKRGRTPGAIAARARD